MELTPRIDELGKVFKRNNYFFTRTSDGEIMIYFEGKEGRYTFRGQTMLEAVRAAEKFAESTIPTFRQIKTEENETK